MKKFFKSLFARTASKESAPQVVNTMGINEVLRKQPGQPPVLRTVSEKPIVAQLPDQGTEREIDFGIDDIALEQTTEDGFNPYDTGRFSASELWEKRHRERMT